MVAEAATITRAPFTTALAFATGDGTVPADTAIVNAA